MADFVDLGGLAGALALIWQITNSLIQHRRGPRLKCYEHITFPIIK